MVAIRLDRISHCRLNDLMRPLEPQLKTDDKNSEAETVRHLMRMGELDHHFAKKFRNA
jgi:hypothetical protein